MKDVFAAECTALAAKDETVGIDMECNEREKYQLIKNAESKFKKQKKKKRAQRKGKREWTQKKKPQNDGNGGGQSSVSTAVKTD